MSDRSSGRLQKIQNKDSKTARILTLSPRHCHMSEIIKRLQWLKVKFRYQAYYNTAPKYLCSSVDHKNNTGSLRSSSQYLLEVPRAKIQSCGARSFL